MCLSGLPYSTFTECEGVEIRPSSSNPWPLPSLPVVPSNVYSLYTGIYTSKEVALAPSEVRDKLRCYIKELPYSLLVTFCLFRVKIPILLEACTNNRQ